MANRVASMSWERWSTVELMAEWKNEGSGARIKMFWVWCGLLVIGIVVTVLLVTFCLPGTTTTTRKSWDVYLYLDQDIEPDHGCLRFYQHPDDRQIRFRPGTKATETVVAPNVLAIVRAGGDVRRNLSLPKERVIGLTHEPTVFTDLSPAAIAHIQKTCGRFLIGDAGQLGPPFETHYAFLPFDHPRHLTPGPPKDRVMSLMYSGKLITEGHRYRQTLAREILKRSLPVDIYGAGCDDFRSEYRGDPRLKGRFETRELYERYRFTLAIENTRESDYISEKFCNAISYGTVPIYWGAPRVEHYFGPGCCLVLTGDLDLDMSLIADVCRDPEALRYRRDLSGARREMEKDGRASLSHFLLTRVIPDLHQ